LENHLFSEDKVIHQNILLISSVILLTNNVGVEIARDMTEQLQLNALKNEYRAYYKNYLLLLTIGLLWSLSAFVGKFDIQISIFILFLGATLFKPIMFGLGTLLRAPKIYND
jgi:hypothetical protein